MISTSSESTKAPSTKGLSLALGNFDGIHLGHQKLLKTAVEYAKSHDLEAGILTFSPHPQAFFEGREMTDLIQTERLKQEVASSFGVEHYICQPFTKEFAAMSHRAFLEDFLVDSLNVKSVVTGFNFRFGKGRQGDCEYLKSMQSELGYVSHCIEAQKVGGLTVSSTRIRNLISQEGDVGLASKLLGRAFCMEQKVQLGKQMGRQLAFPTANLHSHLQLTPKIGVYVGSLEIESNNKFSRPLECIVNVGFRPTLEDSAMNVVTEAHIFDQSFKVMDFYDQTVRLHFHKRVRPEQKFPSKEALVTQISEDIKVAKDYFSKHPLG